MRRKVSDQFIARRREQLRDTLRRLDEAARERLGDALKEIQSQHPAKR